jgi:hypothetical protein
MGERNGGGGEGDAEEIRAFRQFDGFDLRYKI